MIQAFNYQESNMWPSLEEANCIMEPTSTTPYVKYNKFANTLTIKGASTRQAMDEFYSLSIQKFKSNLASKKYGTLNLNFKTFNTSTAKVLFDLFKSIRDEKAAGAAVKIRWEVFLTELDMLETAKDFAELFDLDINLK